jgi:4a-hydroxytetrahydrobiopterin dehydratase
MARPSRLEAHEVDVWLKENPGWERVRTGDEPSAAEGLSRTFKLPDFASALAFAVKLGMLAEKRDHHPDILVGWGKARVLWSTHDAGGITQLDLELARATNALA